MTRTSGLATQPDIVKDVETSQAMTTCSGVVVFPGMLCVEQQKTAILQWTLPNIAGVSIGVWDRTLLVSQDPNWGNCQSENNQAGLL